jgi:hypothetical protein
LFFFFFFFFLFFFFLFLFFFCTSRRVTRRSVDSRSAKQADLVLVRGNPARADRRAVRDGRYGFRNRPWLRP